MYLFKTLTESENQEFRKWVRDNYVPGSDISGLWHPVVQNECTKMNRDEFCAPVEVRR